MTTTLYVLNGSNPVNFTAESSFMQIHTTRAGAEAVLIAKAADDWSENFEDYPEDAPAPRPTNYDAAVAYFAPLDWTYSVEPVEVQEDDLASSASRQHFIETGRYLTVQESHEANPAYCTFAGVSSPCSVCGAKRTTVLT